MEHKKKYPDGKIHEVNMGLTSVLSAPDGPHVDPMNLHIGVHLNSKPLDTKSAHEMPCQHTGDKPLLELMLSMLFHYVIKQHCVSMG